MRDAPSVSFRTPAKTCFFVFFYFLSLSSLSFWFRLCLSLAFLAFLFLKFSFCCSLEPYIQLWQGEPPYLDQSPYSISLQKKKEEKEKRKKQRKKNKPTCTCKKNSRRGRRRREVWRWIRKTTNIFMKIVHQNHKHQRRPTCNDWDPVFCFNQRFVLSKREEKRREEKRREEKRREKRREGKTFDP